MAFVLLLAYALANMMLTHTTDDIHPAKIFMKQVSTVGGEVEVICSTYGFRKDPSELVHIYLCKNGIGVRRQLENKYFETKIILKNVAKNDTGNYSCVFSVSEYEPSEVRRKGDNSVFFQVIGDFIPANIAVRDESVREGDDVVLRCSLQGVQMVHSSASFAYLSKDGVPVQLQTWDTEKNEAKFTINSITKENNGNYSCVLFRSGLLTSTAMKLYGNNTVLLSASATFSGSILAITYVGYILLLILVFMAGVCRYRVTMKGKSKGGPEREQEEDNRNSTEIRHSVPVPEDDTFQETGCHTYESAEFSDEEETSFCDENWVYHEVEVSDYMTTG
ncbi:uncharacterized protein LOC125704153 [Brienomyrus brachyistius]|uniref:uncharacterized protein LOC125704153 n=1 Tax=Brienomyrus brachyistius TaxID=42636 RepID=UPI0020B3DE04|nr:uncharacterized protein LOC125704153 [Brienomyrus brachyistius]